LTTDSLTRGLGTAPDRCSNPSPTTVLLVDDDEDYAQFMQRLIARGHRPLRIDIVHDLATAQDALKASRYDFVFSDYNLKEGTGLDVLEAVRATQPRETLRVLVTGTPHLVPTVPSPARVWDKSWATDTIRAELSRIMQPAP